jgi:hypothetical protein
MQNALDHLMNILGEIKTWHQGFVYTCVNDDDDDDDDDDDAN